MSVHIRLNNGGRVFTNLDVISGTVILNTNREENFGAIVVKLECECRTRLAIPFDDRAAYRHSAGESELEVHKLLYRTCVVFPNAQVAGHASARGAGSFTLPAGQHSWPFQFKIPFNNACAPVHSVFDRIEIAQDFNHHVKRPLPPSLTGFPGMAEIRYYVKATAQRSAFYKENFRTINHFQFFPIEPIRPPPNRRESYARRTFQFAPHVPLPPNSGLFRKQSTTSIDAGPPPNISVDGRLPDPPIVTCNEPLPLRVVVRKLNETKEQLFLHIFQLALIGLTKVRAKDLNRVEASSWVIVSKANMQVPLGDPELAAGQDIDLDPSMWNTLPLVNSVCPTFETCNLGRTYELEISVGLVYGTPGNIKPEVTVQRLRMPCTLFSGIKPPPALLAEMAKQQSLSEPSGFAAGKPTAGPSTNLAAPLPPRPAGPSPEYTPAATSGETPEEPPPSYEDAMATHIAPVDGPRQHYEQPQSAPVEDEKRGSLFG